MSSTSGSTASGSPKADNELERKRARDRKSQRAMRDRTKWNIYELQNRVLYLSQALASETAAFQTLLRTSSEETSRLEAENWALRRQLGIESKFVVGSNNISIGQENFRYPPSAPLMNQLPLPFPRPVPQQRLDPSVMMPMTHANNIGNVLNNPEMVDPKLASSFKQLPIHETVPWESEPTCTSDRIVQSYIEARRLEMTQIGSNVLPPAEYPDVNAILTPTHIANDRSVSSVVSDIVLSYIEINTLPKKVAALYTMYKLLNWLIYRTQSTYDQMPGWLRPEPIQIQVRHPAWIDRVPWPNARAYLVSHPEISFDQFAMSYSSSFEVSWPYNPSHVVVPTTTCAAYATTSHTSLNLSSTNDPSLTQPPRAVCTDQCISLNPVYEQHLRHLKNWTVGEKFRMKFPELSAIIDQDSLAGFE